MSNNQNFILGHNITDEERLELHSINHDIEQAMSFLGGLKIRRDEILKRAKERAEKQ
jgi:hypothetical protein